MRKEEECISLAMTVLQGIFVVILWTGNSWAFPFVMLLLFLQIIYFLICIIKKKYQKKICPKCGTVISIKYRICPNCGHIYKPGCSKENLTEMIEEALEHEKIDEFDQLETSEGRIGEIEQSVIEKYMCNEKEA